MSEHVEADHGDFIKPNYVNEAQFRSMWTEFEWENKVSWLLKVCGT